MTKKDYELIARVFTRHCKVSHVDAKAREAMDMAYDMADALAQDNPRFNRNKFLKACGVE